MTDTSPEAAPADEAPATQPVPGADDDLRTAIARRMAHSDMNRWPDEPAEGAFPLPLANPIWWRKMADIAIETMRVRGVSNAQRRVYAHLHSSIEVGRVSRVERDNVIRLDHGLMPADGGGLREVVVGVELLDVEAVEVDGQIVTPS